MNGFTKKQSPYYTVCMVVEDPFAVMISTLPSSSISVDSKFSICLSRANKTGLLFIH